MREGWNKVKMSEVFYLQMGKTPSRDNNAFWNGESPWVSIADMSNVKYLSDTKEKITKDAIIKTGIKEIPSHTVIMSFKLSVGKVAITTENLYTNEAIMAFIPKEECDLLPEFVYYSLKGHQWEGSNRAVMGITLNKKTISRSEYSFPPLVEQKRIVEELDLLSGIIEKQKQQLKELDTLAQSIFYDMFGDPVTNEKGWEIQLMKEGVNEMFIGPFGSALKKDCFVSEEEGYCMIYEQKHAIQKKLEFETRFITKDKYQSLKRFEVGPGDFIMSCRGTVGQLFLLPDNAPQGIIHPSLMKINIDYNTYNPIFFEWLLSTIIKYETTKGNCVQMAITAKELGNKEVIIPPLHFQNLFASKIEAIEKQKEAITKSIEETQKLFDYTMDKYFG